MKRPFRGLRDRPPRRRYDAVIVGAGIGGLFCANLLQREGLRVLLVEQHYMAGGYCSTFRRAGYTFDAASHFYPLLGNPETLTGKLLVDLGLRTEWVRMDPVDTFHFPDGTSFAVPADRETYLAAVKRLFPREAEALDRFFAAVREAYLSGLLYYFRGQTSTRFERDCDLTVRDVLDRHFRDRKLKLLLTADCPHWGSPPRRTSFVFDSMLRLSYFLGNYYPVGGSQRFADELARRFEELGGDILMSTRVERITLQRIKAERITSEKNRVRGLRLRTLRGRLRGEHAVESPIVVSNADMLLTLERLLPPGSVGEEELTAVRRLRPTYPCFLVHIGLRDVERERLEAVQGYYWEGWDPDRVGRGALRCKIFAPTLYEPRLAPEGGQIVVLQRVQSLDYDRIDDWARHKEEVEEPLLEHLDRVLPETRGRIVVRLSASAETSQRFTFNRAGAMLGWEMSPQQLGEGRPPNAGPVDGLFFVGHWTRPGGGITPVIVSAMTVAEQIATAGPSS